MLMFVLESRLDWFACMFWALILHYCAFKMKLLKRGIVMQGSKTIKAHRIIYYMISLSFASSLALFLVGALELNRENEAKTKSNYNQK